MGRWTLHLAVGLGLLAVLLSCCYAEGEESELINCGGVGGLPCLVLGA